MAVGKRACTAIFICQTHPSANSRQILAAFMKKPRPRRGFFVFDRRCFSRVEAANSGFRPHAAVRAALAVASKRSQNRSKSRHPVRASALAGRVVYS